MKKKEPSWKKTFSISGPNDYPLNVRQLNQTTQSIFITWDAVEDNEKNGKILSYKITYTPFNGKNSPRTINVTAPIVHANLTQLVSYRRYNIKVLASNVHGDGPSTDSVIVRTDTSSKYSKNLITIIILIIFKSGKVSRRGSRNYNNPQSHKSDR